MMHLYYDEKELESKKCAASHFYGRDMYLSRLNAHELQLYKDKVEVDEKKRQTLLNNIQGGTAWQEGRMWRWTLADAGAVCGHLKYKPRPGEPGLIQGKVYGRQFDKKSEARMKRGNQDEPKIRQHFVQELAEHIRERTRQALENKQTEVKLPELPNCPPFEIPTSIRQSFQEGSFEQLPLHAFLVCRESGMMIDEDCPWVAGSDDGDLYLFAIYFFAIFEAKRPERLYDLVPLQYIAQVQGNMHLRRRLAWNSHPLYTYLVCWTPQIYGADVYMYDLNFCTRLLMPRLTESFFLELLPALVQKHSNDKRNAEQASVMQVDTTTPCSFAF
jgi:hypothetical protein